MRRRPARDRVLAVLSLGTVLGLGAVGTLATWTDDTTAASTFATGTVDIGLTADNLKSTAFSGLAISNLKPAQTKAALITVRNRGSLPFTYALGVTATNSDGKNLQGALQVLVRTGATVATSGANSTCSGGTQVFSRTGLPGTNAVAGQRGAVGSSTADQVVCVQVTLPTAAASSLQTATTNATFTFTATNVE